MIVHIRGVSFDVTYNKDIDNIEEIIIAGANDICDYNLIDVLSDVVFNEIYKYVLDDI